MQNVKVKEDKQQGSDSVQRRVAQIDRMRENLARLAKQASNLEYEIGQGARPLSNEDRLLIRWSQMADFNSMVEEMKILFMLGSDRDRLLDLVAGFLDENLV